MRDLLSKLDAILSENDELEAIKQHPEADDPRIQKAIADKEKEQGDVEESSKYSPTDDVVGFTVNSEKAYNVVMRQFGEYIDFDEDEGVMYVPEKMWPRVEMTAFDADGEGAKKVDDDRNWDDEDLQGYADRSADADAADYHRESIDLPRVGDEVGISFSEDFEVATTISGFTEDGFIVALDDVAIEHLLQNGITFLEGELVESLKDPKKNPCWKGYHPVGTKQKGGKTVPNCVPKESIEEAEYQGRKVSLGKPTQGDVKKFKVYVKNPQGNVVKVNFGDKDMKIKKSNPARRKSFRARHNCDNPGPRHKARYWSCRKW